MKINVEHIDDYARLLGNDKFGNRYKSLINKHFNGKDELLFALLEHTTVENLEHVGTVLVYSALDNKGANKLIRQYRSLVKKHLKDQKLNLSNHSDWYNTELWYLSAKNGEPNYYARHRRDWNIDYHTEETPDLKTNSNEALDQNLTDKRIKEFLEEYFRKLVSHKSLRLNQFKYLTMMVKPISLRKGERTIPLGNLYLHFATKTELAIDFYLDLLHDYLIVWNNEEGIEILDTLLNAVKAKSYLYKINHKGLSRKMGHYDGHDYFHELFNNNDKLNEYREYSFVLNNMLVERLNKVINEGRIKDYENINLFNEDQLKKLPSNLFKATGFKDLERNDNIQELDRFITLLLRRQIAHQAIVNFGFSISHAVNMFSRGKIYPDRNEKKIDKAKAYRICNSQLWLKVSSYQKDEVSKMHVEKVVSELKESMSQFEKILINACKPSSSNNHN